MRKLLQLEESIKDLRSQNDNLARQRDSLDILITSQAQHISKSSTEYQKETRALDSTLAVFSTRNTALASQRTQSAQKLTASQNSARTAIGKSSPN